MGNSLLSKVLKEGRWYNTVNKWTEIGDKLKQSSLG